MNVRPDNSCLAAIRADVMKRGGSFVPDIHPLQHDVAMWRAVERLGGEGQGSLVQIRADFLLELTRIATVRIYPHWTLAGEHMIGRPECHSCACWRRTRPSSGWRISASTLRRPIKFAARSSL